MVVAAGQGSWRCCPVVEEENQETAPADHLPAAILAWF